jgi:hypothetical protein
MRSDRIGAWMLGLGLVVAGCATTKVTRQERLVDGPLPRPDRIWVYDFVATAADVPTDSALAGRYSDHAQPQTAEQIDAGRKVGAEIASKLVEEIRAMGLSAERGSSATRARVNDIIIRGYLLSVKEGSTVERMAIGFGVGSSELKSMVEGYQMTANGLRKLGSATLDAAGSKGPGAAAPLALAVATGNPIGLIVSTGVKVYGEASGKSRIEGRADQTVKEIGAGLKTRFAAQGWID